MARLIHLNGPSRVGKSTLARRYVDDHPGTLCLDVDVLVGLIGGWSDDISRAHDRARTDALAAAGAHLRQGEDVVAPQLVTVHDRDVRFRTTAAEAGAEYVEIALLVDDDEHDQRLRDKQPEHAVEAQIQGELMAGDLVTRIRGHLRAYLADRPATMQLDTTGLTVEQTYARLLDLLAEGHPAARGVVSPRPR